MVNLSKIRQWRQDSRDLQMIIKARMISRNAALNALAVVIAEREQTTNELINGPMR